MKIPAIAAVLLLVAACWFGSRLGVKQGYFTPSFTDACLTARGFVQSAADARRRAEGLEPVPLVFDGGTTSQLAAATDWEVRETASLGGTKLTYTVKERWIAGRGFKLQAIEIWRDTGTGRAQGLPAKKDIGIENTR